MLKTGSISEDVLIERHRGVDLCKNVGRSKLHSRLVK